MYRAGLESILGFHKAGDTLRFEPCIPARWREYHIEYLFGETVYHIAVSNPHEIQRGVSRLTLDGGEITDGQILLVDDHRAHHVAVLMGE
jgi:cellobiose phosphorylase